MANPKGNPDVPAFQEQQKKTLTSEEASRLGKIGGRITSDRRKKRKALQEALEIAEDHFTTKTIEASKNLSEGEKKLLEEVGITVFNLYDGMKKASTATTIKDPKTGEVKSIINPDFKLMLDYLKEISDRKDGKPVQTIKQTNRNIDGATIDDEGNQEA